jgi:hypothetical protein
MFRVQGHQAVGPAMAPIITEFNQAQGIIPFLEGLRAINPTTQSAVLSIIVNLSAKAVEDTELGRNCAPMFGPGVAKSINDTINSDPEDPNDPTERDMLIARAKGQLDTARVWIVDLVNASKKKELTGTNVDSYYSSLSRSDVKGAPIATLINRIANFLPDMINQEQFRNELTDNVWTSYQVSRVSTGKLLFEVRRHFIALGIYNQNSAEDLAIIASKDNPHDITLSYNIPKHLVGYASLFFQAAGKDVGKWYQGDKYESEIPAAKVKTIKAIFKKYLEIDSNVAGIEEAATVDRLKNTIGAGFW